MRALILLAVLLLGAGSGSAQPLISTAGPLRMERMVGGLDQPWGVAPLADGRFLVTERGGRLLLVADGRARVVRGTPEVVARGQGGLLDVTLARNFDSSRELFLTYARRQGTGAGTALAVARLSDDARRLENLTIIFEAAPGASTNRHFGSRVVEARDGSLYLTIGDRGSKDNAQTLTNHNGKVIRINRDGTIPPDNPFVDRPGARPEIWSLGQRNAQGAALDARGTLWTVEHGARGGDEINRIRPGVNYGWPVISYGVHYDGSKIGIGTRAPGMAQPAFYWDPSIAPSGLMIYSGKRWPQWRGDFFVGSLKFDMISRLSGMPLREVERISGPQTGRVRDIVEAPDGSIWFISVDNGAVYRMTPE